MMEQKVDYHIHTTYSDGTFTPTEVVKWAKEKELTTIAITDHDGVGGIMEGQIAGEALDITVIPGIELSTETEEGIGLHILGYNFDKEDEALNEACRWMREKRRERNALLFQELEKEGYPLTMEDLPIKKGQDYIGKPIFARAMVAKGYIEEMGEAFTKIFCKERFRKIKKEKIKTEEAIQLIKKAGGTPVLAHPGSIRGIGERNTPEFYKNMDKLLKRLKKQGLKGLECIYKKHSEEEEMAFIQLAEKYHLHITTGSDFHGEE